MRITTWFVCTLSVATTFGCPADAGFIPPDAPEQRVYDNQLKPIADPKPILADYPQFVEPIRELGRFEAPTLVDDADADLLVRAWRFSYNARGIIEMPNRLRAAETAIIMVHPWGIDDGQGWNTPEPAGCADFCTPTKNHLAARHTREVIDPFHKSLRGKVAAVLYSLPGSCDPIRRKLYRSCTHHPDEQERKQGALELDAPARGPPEYIRWAAATIGSLQMRPVILVAVIRHPLLVRVLQLRPGLRLAEVPVGQAPLDVEVRLDIRLPGLARIDPAAVQSDGAVQAVPATSRRLTSCV